MIDLKQLQKEIYQNKLNKGFNTTDICREICNIHGELSEAYGAYMKKKDDLGEELADVAIFLLGLAEILGINLEEEIINKVAKNEKREYSKLNGVNLKLNE
jgi:NTP pyrophosphatase (non-canonical NTP hydrolase)